MTEAERVNGRKANDSMAYRRWPWDDDGDPDAIAAPFVLVKWSAAAEDEGSDVRNWRQLIRTAEVRGTRRGAPLPGLRRPLRVLVVDDDCDTVNAMATLLALWGHAAQQTYSAAAALAVVAIAPPDVVLLDLAMPQVDGCELARRLRDNPSTTDCLLIAITGYSDARRREQCEEADIDVCLFKPVDPAIIETLMQLESARLGRTPRDECPAALLHRA